jgi:hypothetical protein
MLSMIEQLPPLHTFLKSTFFNRNTTFPTDAVDFDVRKGGIAMAPFVSPRMGSTTMERKGYATKSYKPPLVAPKRVMTIEDIGQRMAGERLFGGYNPNERATKLLMQDMIELDNAITRREEWMCAQVLFKGKISIIGEGVNEEIEFNFANRKVLTGNGLWTNPDSNPIKDLRDARKAVARGGVSANICIMGNDVIDVFLSNKKVQERLHQPSPNLQYGIIKPKVLENGAMYYGFIAEANLHIYTYDGEFADNDNINPEYPNVSIDDKEFIPAMYPLVPLGSVFIGSTNMNAEILYAVVKDLQIGSVMSSRVPKTWDQQEPSEKYIKISSRPLPVPKDIDSWYILEVL